MFAFAVVSILQGFHVWDPFALIFLVAVVVSVRSGGTGPAILAIALSSIALNYFLHSPRGWLRINVYDIPAYSIFVLLGFFIYRMNRSELRIS